MTIFPFLATVTASPGVVGDVSARGAAACVTMPLTALPYDLSTTKGQTVYVKLALGSGTPYTAVVLEGLLADGTTWATAVGPDGATPIALTIGASMQQYVLGMAYLGLRCRATTGGENSTPSSMIAGLVL